MSGMKNISSEESRDACRHLANAIVIRAVMDYRRALKRVKKNPFRKEAINEALKVEEFFRSEWYQVLTSVDGEYLIDKLRSELR